MTSAVDWLMSKFGTNLARNSKFHIRMTILCQLRDSVTPALRKLNIYVLCSLQYKSLKQNAKKVHHACEKCLSRRCVSARKCLDTYTKHLYLW